MTERSHVTTEEIETMLKDASQEFLKSKPSELKRLGIDEIAWGQFFLDITGQPLNPTAPLCIDRPSIEGCPVRTGFLQGVKGQGNYCAVLIDLDKGNLIAIIEKRTQAHLREVATQWGTEILEQIEEVSIDLWLAYKNLVEELMPNAQVLPRKS